LGREEEEEITTNLTRLTNERTRDQAERALFVRFVVKT
jgi:hypothetical protein